MYARPGRPGEIEQVAALDLVVRAPNAAEI
jgi:hypothetical protein